MVKKIPDFYLEQYLLNELPEKKQILVSQSNELLDKIRDIEIDNHEIMGKYPPKLFISQIYEKLDHRKPRSILRPFSVKMRFPLVAAACVALFFAFFPIIQRSTGFNENISQGTTRVKGFRPTLNIYRETTEGPELLKSLTKVREHDLLQISYSSAGEKYGVIFSVDGRGIVTLHYPEDLASTPLLNKAGETSLRFSYKLDDAPKFEEFFFVTSKNIFSVSSLIENVRSQAAYNLSLNEEIAFRISLPKSFRQTSILLIKVK